MSFLTDQIDHWHAHIIDGLRKEHFRDAISDCVMEVMREAYERGRKDEKLVYGSMLDRVATSPEAHF